MPSGVRYWADLPRREQRRPRTRSSTRLRRRRNRWRCTARRRRKCVGTAAIQAFINSMYQGMFGRDADAAGLKFYTDGYIDGTFTQGSIALNILNGAQGDDLVAVNNKIAGRQHLHANPGRAFLRRPHFRPGHGRSTPPTTATPTRRPRAHFSPRCCPTRPRSRRTRRSETSSRPASPTPATRFSPRTSRSPRTFRASSRAAPCCSPSRRRTSLSRGTDYAYTLSGTRAHRG